MRWAFKHLLGTNHDYSLRLKCKFMRKNFKFMRKKIWNLFVFSSRKHIASLWINLITLYNFIISENVFIWQIYDFNLGNSYIFLGILPPLPGLVTFSSYLMALKCCCNWLMRPQKRLFQKLSHHDTWTLFWWPEKPVFIHSLINFTVLLPLGSCPLSLIELPCPLVFLFVKHFRKELYK